MLELRRLRAKAERFGFGAIRSVFVEWIFARTWEYTVAVQSCFSERWSAGWIIGVLAMVVSTSCCLCGWPQLILRSSTFRLPGAIGVRSHLYRMPSFHI